MGGAGMATTVSIIMATPLQGWWIIGDTNPYLWVNECGKPRLH